MSNINYPAASIAQAVELTIEDSNILHNVINSDSATEITVDDGTIPSVRKMILDNYYFKDPIDWVEGGVVTTFNQLVKFTDGTIWLSPLATPSKPVLMEVTPYGSALWRIAPFSLDGNVFTLTADYTSTTTFSVLGDYIEVLAVGQRITLNFNSSDVVYSTITGASFDGTSTLVVIEDALVTTDIVSVATTYWPYAEIENIKEYSEYTTTWTETSSLTETSPEGKEQRTIAGINAVFDTQLSQQQTDFDNQQAAAIASAGYEIIGNFADGCTLTKLSDAVYYAGDVLNNNANEGFYARNGVFPKTVIAGTSPFDEAGWLMAATGYTKQSGAIQLFGQTVDADISIPVGQNALSINPTISDGVTVTVPAGSEYVILGSTI